MRTTLTIDDDVLTAVKGLADQQHKTIGEIISTLARQALKPTVSDRTMRNGVPLLATRTDIPSATLELVNRLRDELP